MNIIRKIKGIFHIKKHKLQDTINEIYKNKSTDSIQVVFKEELQFCSICLDNIDNNLKQTQCNHYFHKECLNKWLNNNNTCPNCREELKKDKKIENMFLINEIYIIQHPINLIDSEYRQYEN